MQRVHTDRVTTGDASQESAFHEFDFMGRGVLDIERCRLVFPVIEAAGDFFQMLVKGAAECHIHFLKAAAHGKERFAQIDDLANERDAGCVPARVLQHVFTGRRTAIKRR